MGLEGTINSEEGIKTMEKLNTAFTFIFTTELVLKNISLGTIDYLRDKINVFDAILVSISLVEFITSSGGNSGFSAFRALRIFRVLRVTRLIRSLKYMRVIMRVLSNTIGSAIYIGLLLFLFIFVYAILGMNMYRFKLTKTNGLNKPYR
jgi:hypothetical protein